MKTVTPLRGYKIMIKLTFAQIRDPEFNPILSRIMRASVPVKTAKRFLDIAKELQAEQAKTDELWKGITEKYMEPVPNSQFMRLKETLSEDEKKAAEAAIKEFHEATIEIQKPRLTEQELQAVNLSASDLIKLQGLIDGVEL